MEMEMEMEPLHAPVGHMQPVVENTEGLPQELIMDQPAGTKVKPPLRQSSLFGIKEEKDKLTYELLQDYKSDLLDRDDWTKMRIQRTAKYRGWREKKTYPWEDAMNSHLPIIMTDVQRTEDTLHNAVLSTRPVMNAKSMGKDWKDSEKPLDDLLDYQVFIENKGEERIGNLISSFTQDGQFIAYVPYVRERQKIVRKYTLDYPKPNVTWETYLFDALREYYPGAVILPGTNAPWNWVVRQQHPLTGDIMEFKADVSQENDEKIQILCRHDEMIFDGPALIPVELENIVVPTRCENLQPKSMANPTGADRVAMVDYPTRDEIKRLWKSGFYNELTDEDWKTLEASPVDSQLQAHDTQQDQKRLQDDLTGVQQQKESPKESKTFTRLTIFKKADLDGDGFEEEVVFWMLEEPRILLRARYLTEVYPISPPRRPFAMAKYIPVNGQFYAIGLIELMESGYDIIKRVFDQMIDCGELTNTPIGFYRPMSGIKPEVIRAGPGDWIPTNNPKDDVYIPPMQNGMAAFGHNIITVVSQILDQATLVGQLQLGGVPQGRSAALRTTSNMQALLQQGDARPERVLRRFFGGLVEVWQQFFELNKVNLPNKKKYRVMHGSTDSTDPFRELDNKAVLQGRFTFDFTASILNTNKALATQAHKEIIGVLINPLMLQMGMVTPDKVFRLISDYIKDYGQEPLNYISYPPGMEPYSGPLISAEEAIMSIMNGRYPVGRPIEPLQEHIMKLQTFAGPENLQYFDPGQAQMLGMYAASKVQEFQQLIQQQQMMAAAAQFQQQQQSGKGGPQGETNPPNQGAGGNPQVNKNEAIDETLPMAGGGAAKG